MSDEDTQRTTNEHRVFDVRLEVDDLAAWQRVRGFLIEVRELAEAHPGIHVVEAETQRGTAST